jgi:superfamily II DNA/RNA helicase
MLFSATLDRNIDDLVRRYLHDPVLATVDRAAGAVTAMEHHVLNVHPADKYATATEIAARDGRVLMFLDTKHGVDQFTRHLRGSGIRAAALHSGKSQPQRTHTLAQFKEGEINVLVATNVAARGIHIEGLDLVVNVDAPADPKDYLHRGGRTARAGESGSVVTLVTPNQRRDVNRMMSDAGIRPVVTQVRSGEEKLSSITGAKRPPAAAKATGNAAFRGMGTRPGSAPKESRKAAEARKVAEARRAARVRRGR